MMVEPLFAIKKFCVFESKRWWNHRLKNSLMFQKARRAEWSATIGSLGPGNQELIGAESFGDTRRDWLCLLIDCAPFCSARNDHS